MRECHSVSPRLLTGVTILAALLVPSHSAAQDHHHEQPDWIADVGVAGANTALSGIAAAVTAGIRGEDVYRAFLRGAVGGGVVFAGKRIAVERFDGAGLLGRELASVGTSVVGNAGAGRGWFEEVWLPVGPVWLQVSSGERRRVRLNLRDVGATAWAIHRPELEMDWSRSLSNGAITFVAPGHRIRSDSRHADGVAIGGLILLGVTPFDREVVQSHENVHVIQRDFMLQTLSRPVEAWGWSWITDRDVPLDIGVLPGLMYPDILRSAAESEAEILEVR